MRFNNTCKISLLTIFIILATPPFSFPNKKTNLADQQIQINFDKRLQFYLDMKTKRFLQKMSIKEAFLLQMIKNITSTMKARGKDRLIADDVGFEIVYGESNELLESYSKEIDAIIYIINEVEKLERAIIRSEDLKLLNEVDELKENLEIALGKKKLIPVHKTKQQIAEMISDYSNEVNSLLNLYERIELFKRKAQAIGDDEMVNQLEEQKRRVVKALELGRMAGPEANKAVDEYIKEATRLVYILKELDKLEVQAEEDTLMVSLNIDSLRSNLVNNIDERILKLFGYTSKITAAGPTISEYYKEWKAERIAEYQLKLTQYRLIRNKLIKTATNKERDQMLERELKNALLNYADEKYELAILQFDEIIKTYNFYYPNLDGVIFYKSEANYGIGYFDEAYDGYKKIVEEFPDSQYSGKSYLRLILISYTYGWYDKSLNYFEKFQAVANVPIEDLDQANYLVGFIYFKQKRYEKSVEVLKNTSKNSKYYMPAQYLLGIVYANLDNYSKAKLIFSKLIDKRSYPWTDINTTVIRNEALLKLGYIHYQRGEYDQAISYFEQVSKGYDKYDSSLMGQAWAKMKKGDYEVAINQVNALTNNYLLSNYTYEAHVLAAHCKKIQKKTSEALKDLYYVSNAREVLEKAKEYNEERSHILAQMDELERLEEQILERQDRKLYPKVVRIRDTINNALMSFYYRGAISSRILEEFNDERNILIMQIQEFESMMKFAEQQQNEKLYQDAKAQRDRLLLVLETYQLDKTISRVNYFIDYPLATKEGGILYRKDIIKKVMGELLSEKRKVKTDLEMITQLLASSNSGTKMEIIMDLEILEEDMKDLHNQLNKFQVWISNHQIPDIKTDADQWADFSGFGISDINYASYVEQTQKINTLSKNITNIDNILEQKKEQLEKKIALFDNKAQKIQKEMEAEKIRLEKLEKEKYFHDIYFDTKVKEIGVEEDNKGNLNLENQEP